MFKDLIDFDRHLFIYLNGLGDPSWDNFWLYMSKTLSFVTIPIYVFVLLYSYSKLGIRKLMIMVVVVALLIFSTEQLSIFFKQSVGRLRPCYDNEIHEIMRVVKSYCGGKYSYFSAHAANSFAFAGFFIIQFRKDKKIISLLLLTWSLLVSYSRIYIGVHFPLDVLTGATVGMFLAWLFTKLYFFSVEKI